VWSFDETTGQWRSEGTFPVQGTPGALFVDASVSHLSYFATGWMEETCVARVRVQNATLSTLPLQLGVVGTSGGYLFQSTFARGLVELSNAPRALPVDATVTYLGAGLGRASTPDLCAGDLVIDAAAPVAPTGTLVVRVEEACTDRDARQPQPSASVVVRRTELDPFLSIPQELQVVDRTGASGETAPMTLPVGSYVVSASTFGGATATANVTVQPGANQVTVVAQVTCVITGGSGTGGR
jgi:hypothetical protein